MSEQLILFIIILVLVFNHESSFLHIHNHEQHGITFIYVRTDGEL